MKIRFIVNPIAGNRTQKNINTLLEKHLTEKYDIFYTKKRGDARLLAKQAIKEGINKIISVGGDGTINEIASVIINTDKILGVIPCGSGNGFAYHIGMSNKIKEAIKQLNSSKIRTIDSGIINNQHFLNVSGVGFDAHIANIFSKFINRGFINYILVILKNLHYKSKNYIIEYNNKVIKRDAFLIAFANSSQYGNNAYISPRAKISDGLLDVVIIKKFSKWRLPFMFYMMFKGNIHNSRYVEIIQAKKIKITTKEEMTHLDGESYKLNNPLHVKINHKSLKILVPNEK